MTAVPTIHMNGTSKSSLLEEIETAYTAINDAIDAMKQAAPNGRDYYPQGPDAYEKARADHMRRMAALQDIQNEYEALAIAIQNGGHKAVQL